MLIGKLQSLPLGDESAARKALSKVINSEDATPEQKAEALALRSAVQKEEKDTLADLNKAIELQPEKADYLRLRAQHLYEEDKFDEALADADKALKIEPEHAATNELRGMVLLGLNKYDEALKSFDRSTELVPQSPLPYQHRGEMYRQKGDLQKALEQLTKALELQPQSIATLLVRAGVYYELKQPEKAIEDIDKAIELQPTLAQPHLMKVEILAATKHFDQAIAHMEKLLQSAPGNEQLLERLGTLYLMANQPRKAIESATQVIVEGPRQLRRAPLASRCQSQHRQARRGNCRFRQSARPEGRRPELAQQLRLGARHVARRQRPRRRKGPEARHQGSRRDR